MYGNLGIVGVSGVVGSKFLEVLKEYNLEFDNYRFFNFLNGTPGS